MRHWSREHRKNMRARENKHMDKKMKNPQIMLHHCSTLKNKENKY